MKKLLSLFILSAIITPLTGGLGLAMGIVAFIGMITPNMPGVAIFLVFQVTL